MRLLVVSCTPHWQKGDKIVGWGPTVTEINHISELFDGVDVLATMYPGAPSPAAVEYNPKVTFHPLAPAGGESLAKKLSAALHLLLCMKKIVSLAERADVVHIRAPCNVALVALFYSLVDARNFKWVKYAGSWGGYPAEPWSYRLQRFLIRRISNCFVTVNGKWGGQPKSVYTFCNPCLTEEELGEARATASRKKLGLPVRLLCVGRTEGRRFDLVIKSVKNLADSGFDVRLDLIVSGRNAQYLKELSSRLGVTDKVFFHDFMPQSSLREFYAKSHFVVHPSSSEGFPKVLSEAMAYKICCLATDVGVIRQFFEEHRCGVIIKRDAENIAQEIEKIYSDNTSWEELTGNGQKVACLFAYEKYVKQIKEILAVMGFSPQ